MNCQIFDTAPRCWRTTMTRLSRRSLILLILPLALGATQANAQAQASSVNVPIGGAYVFKRTDFGGFGSTHGTLYLYSQPTHGRVFNVSLNRDVDVLGDDDGGDAHFWSADFTGSGGTGTMEYRPPAAAVSVVNGYDSFIFETRSFGNHIRATMTINLVGASTQTDASGAPKITTATDTHRISASITGVTDLNGIDVGTLSWQWQQADAPASGVPAPSDYIVDIEDATSSLFAPTAAQLGRYVRACVSFMDQHDTPEPEGPLCSAGTQVTELPPDIRLRLRLFLEGPLR